MIYFDLINPFFHWLIPTIGLIMSVASIIIITRIVIRKILEKQKFNSVWIFLLTLSFTVSICTVLFVTPIFLSIFTTTLHVNVAEPADMKHIVRTHPALLDGLKYVTFGKPSLLSYRRIFYEGSSGNYNPSDRSIYIYGENINVYTWWHELGHHVWFIHTTREEKRAWINHYNTEKFYPTNYSMKNAQEDFADSFMLYIGYNDLRGQMIDKTKPTGLNVNRRYMIETIIQRLTGCEPVNHLCYYNYNYND